MSCDKCPLHASVGIIRTGIPGKGIPGGVLYIGIGPGSEENLHGECFIGRSGRRMEILNQRHLGPTPWAYTNLVGCMPPKNKPPVACTRVCWPLFGEQDIARFQPKVLVLLGNIVADFLLGSETGSSVSSRRCRTYEYKGIPTIVTYHPAATLRQGTGKSREALTCLIQDVSRAGKMARGELITTFTPEDYTGDFTGQDIVVDIETTSLRPWRGQIKLVGIALASDPKKRVLYGPDQMSYVEHVLRSARSIVGWNFPFDSQWLPESVYEKPWTDGMVLHGLLYPDNKSRSLKVAGPEVTGIRYSKTLDDGIIDDDEELRAYNSLDLYQTGAATQMYLSKIDGTIPRHWVMDLTRRLAKLQRFGCHLNRLSLGRAIGLQWHELQNQVLVMSMLAKRNGLDLGFESAGEYRMKMSKNKLLELVYDKLQYPYQRTDKGNLSLDQESREALRDHDSAGILGSYEKYLQAQKNLTTYLLPLTSPDMVDPNDIMHPSPHVVPRDQSADASEQGRGGGAVTGRIVWLDPSLQVFPPECRCVVDSRFPGGRIAVADLSQIEPRCLAWLSGEEQLIEAYRTDGDFYRVVMGQALGISPDAVTDEQRAVGKTVVLAILYGARERKIVEVFFLEGGITIAMHEATQFIHAFYRKMPRLMAFADGIRDRVDNGLPIVTATGRRRVFPVGGAHERDRVYRQAINYPVQSLASDINHALLMSMPDEPCPGVYCMPPTVHDSLAFDCENGSDPVSGLMPYYDACQSTIRDQFGIDFTVPVKVKIKVGACWQ